MNWEFNQWNNQNLHQRKKMFKFKNSDTHLLLIYFFYQKNNDGKNNLDLAHYHRWFVVMKQMMEGLLVILWRDEIYLGCILGKYN